MSEYFKEQIGTKSVDEYVDFVNALKMVKNNYNVSNKAEFYWEIQKYYDVKRPPYSNVDFSTIMNEDFARNKFTQLLVEQAEPWELDMILAGLQNFDPWSEYDTHSNHLESYKQRHGKEFNKEEIFKNTIKYLVNQGALLNPYFFSFKEKRIKTINVIDRLEELYVLCERPLEIYMPGENYVDKRYLVETTPFNRFLNKYYSFKLSLGYYSNNENALSPKEMYDLVLNDSDNSRAIDIICKQKNININRDKQYVLADIHFELAVWKKHKSEYLLKEEEIKRGIAEIEKYRSMLEKGQKTFEESYLVEVGPKSIRELIDYVCLWKSNLSLAEFKEERNKKLTDSLMNEIDNLSIEEIREKYFFKETMEEVKHD